MQLALREGLKELARGLSTGLVVAAGARCPTCPECHCQVECAACHCHTSPIASSGGGWPWSVGLLFLCLAGGLGFYIGRLPIGSSSPSSPPSPWGKGSKKGGIWLGDNGAAGAEVSRG